MWRYSQAIRIPVNHRCFLPLAICFLSVIGLTSKVALAESETLRTNLSRAKVFLAAGDYRLALEACLKEVKEAPSPESYTYVTYVYHAIDGYLEHLSKQDQWVKVEQLYLNLSSRGVEDVIDPPDVLARIAKEIIQGAVRKQSDVTAAMAVRLDKETVERLWKQQAAWRKARPQDWWAGVPDAWRW